MGMRISDDIFSIVIGAMDTGNHEKHCLKVIVSELFANAYQHGNKQDPAKNVDVIFDISDREFSVVVKDEGAGVAKTALWSLSEALPEPYEVRGRGIRIVRKLSDKVDVFKDSQGKFCIRATKRLINNRDKKCVVASHEQSKEGL
jgi:anti-sigma regulatory factor (Ser/Thr protein kinase)